MDRPAETVTIVMVEDDDGHARLIERTLRRAGVSNQVRHFTTGQAALDHLLDGGRTEMPLRRPELQRLHHQASERRDLRRGDPPARPGPGGDPGAGVLMVGTA